MDDKAIDASKSIYTSFIQSEEPAERIQLTLTFAYTNVRSQGFEMKRRSAGDSTGMVLRALSEPRRVAILKVLRNRELRAGQIADNFNTTRSAISQHLRVLIRAGLLIERRRGTSRLYRLRARGFARVRALLDTFWEHGLARLKMEAEKQARSERG